jgi:hypothetical protein
MREKADTTGVMDLLKHSIVEDMRLFDEQGKIDFLNELKAFLHEISPLAAQPVDLVEWVDVESVEANNYNPNSVASKEMELLHTSIKHDGYTQPVVTIFDEEAGKYIIIDGFHRFFTCKNAKDIRAANKGRLPVVVLKKSMNERMAATVRHNRARGSHSVNGMSNMVFKMLDNGWADEDICNHLGMGADELLRLKHVTGFSKLFEDVEYSKSWVTKNQVLLKKKYEDELSESDRK